MFAIPFLRPGPRRNVLLSLFGALAIIGLAACGSASLPPTPESPSASPPSPMQSPQSDDFGPLAVIDSVGGSLALGGTSPVRIEDNCVTMTRENGEALLLIWHSAEVVWDEQEQEITLFPPAAGVAPITISDGDIITVGGSGLVGDVPVERNLVWLAPPHATCSGEPWSVASLTKS